MTNMTVSQRTVADLKAKLAERDRRIAELEGALRPIAAWYEQTTKANQWMTSTNNPLEPSFDRVAQDWDLTLDDIRTAAAALTNKGATR